MTAREKVAAGIAVLHRRFEQGWWWRPDLAHFDMNHDEMCVLAQLGPVRSFEYTADDLFGPGAEDELVAHGFLVVDPEIFGQRRDALEAEYAELTFEWIAQINALRDAHPYEELAVP